MRARGQTSNSKSLQVYSVRFSLNKDRWEPLWQLMKASCREPRQETFCAVSDILFVLFTSYYFLLILQGADEPIMGVSEPEISHAKKYYLQANER